MLTTEQEIIDNCFEFAMNHINGHENDIVDLRFKDMAHIATAYYDSLYLGTTALLKIDPVELEQRLAEDKRFQSFIY